jgi:hypothetical protein
MINILNQELDIPAIDKALELGAKLLETTQADARLGIGAQEAWKHEVNASNARLQEIRDRQDMPEFKTTHKDRTVFLMHLSLAERYAAILESRT